MTHSCHFKMTDILSNDNSLHLMILHRMTVSQLTLPTYTEMKLPCGIWNDVTPNDNAIWHIKRTFFQTSLVQSTIILPTPHKMTLSVAGRYISKHYLLLFCSDYLKRHFEQRIRRWPSGKIVKWIRLPFSKRSQSKKIWILLQVIQIEES